MSGINKRLYCQLTDFPNSEWYDEKVRNFRQDLSRQYEIRTNQHWLSSYCALSGSVADGEFQFLCELDRRGI